MAWIFRAPEPIVDRLRTLTSDEWPAEQHFSLMSPGDVVFFWEGDADGRVVGVGRIQTQAYRPVGDPRRMRIRVGHNIVLGAPMTAEEFRADPILRGLPVLARADATNYGLSRALADRLLAVVAAGEPRLAAALNMPKNRIPRVVTLPPEPGPVAAPTPEPEEVRGPYTAAMEDEVRAFREDTANGYLIALRSLAYDRLRGFLTPEVLADAMAADVAREAGGIGAIVLDGERLAIGEALSRLVATDADIDALARAGTLGTEGTLTWGIGGEPLRAPADDVGATLRLRAGLAHLLSDNLPLATRIGRMRRSVSALWPEVATGILMVLDSEEQIVYHRPALDALPSIGVPEPFRDTVEDYRRYAELAREFRDRHGFGSLAEVDLFLVRRAHPEWPAMPEGEPDRPAERLIESAAPEEIAETTPSETPGDEKTDDRSAEPPDREEAMHAPTNRPAKTRRLNPNEGQAVFALYQCLRHDRVVIGLEQVINIYLSLKTIPMLVLDGPSGVGKNLLARAMAEAMGARYFWLPVSNESGTGPADAPLRMRDLLGQVDPRTGQYRPELWYEAILDAHEHPTETVILCVDTLDGWQEDSWLSEYVRLQDSRRKTPEGAWATEPLIVAPGYSELPVVDGRTVPARLPLPDNLFLIMTTMGSVGLGNISVEHTNVVELSPPDLSLDLIRPGHAPEATTPRGLGEILAGERRYRTIEELLDRSWIETWNAEIEQLAQILEAADLPVGYRLRDDILRYLAYADDLNAQLPYGTSFALEVGFDYQLAQRIVPRFLLREPDDEAITELLMYAQGEQGRGPRFPRAAGYLESLQRRME